MSRKHNYRVHINLLIFLLSLGFCLTMLAVSWYCIHTRSQPLPAAGQPASLVTEGDVKTGTLHNLEERQKGLSQTVEGDTLTFSINAALFMKNGAPTAGLLVENPPGNGKRFTIITERDDTGEKIY